MLHGIAQRRIDRIAHPRRHGTRHFQVFRRNRIALPVIGKDNSSDALAQIPKIYRHGQNRHQFGRYRDVRAGHHAVPVHFSFAKADLHFPERLAAEVHHKVPLNPVRIDIQPANPDLRKTLVVVIALMLHAGIQGGHAQIVRICNIIDIPGQAEREFRHGNQQGVPPARGGPLHIHGRAA